MGEHSNAAYEGEETNPNLSSSDTSNASSEPYASFSADNLAYSRDSGSYPDINTPTSSINSNSGKNEATTENSDIHVPSNENDFPNFDNRFIINMQFNQQQEQTRDRSWPKVFHPRLYETRDSSWHDSKPGEVTSLPSKCNNNEDGFNSNEDMEEEKNPHPITHFPSTYNNPVGSFKLNYEKEEESQSHQDLKSKKNCHWRKWFVFVFICVCVSGVAAWIVQKEYGSKKETPEDPPTPSLIVDKCENDISTATVGEPICIPYTQQFTSNPSSIQVKQVSSQYFSVLPSFSINVSSDTVFQTKENWIVYFNISRPDQQLRFIKENATCDSIGIYEITIKYDDGNFTSFKFNISFKDPQLKQSVTRINDNIHVHCEMKKTCMASSLALFVNDGGSSRLIPDIDVCSYTDKNSGTTVSAEAIIHVSQLSENQTISCVPLMTNMELSANLTSTSGIPLCEGDCVPDCKDNPQGEAYFPDKNDCTQFYQCSNGQLVSQSCSPSTYWSTSECTCVHFDDEICNRDTNRFLSPLLSIEKCTNSSLV